MNNTPITLTKKRIREREKTNNNRNKGKRNNIAKRGIIKYLIRDTTKGNSNDKRNEK